MAKITTMAVVAAIALVLLPVGRGEEMPTAAHPHGLSFESPLALSPAAYDFFHPSARARRAHGVAPVPALAPRGQEQLRPEGVRGQKNIGERSEGRPGRRGRGARGDAPAPQPQGDMRVRRRRSSRASGYRRGVRRGAAPGRSGARWRGRAQVERVVASGPADW
ncbi:uncharacterized protein [Zea mays]|jgi:hypothetical protein|uniref:Uncharacterized protein n=2 Tax=Zea mays TaxID=4577 RepID=A0A804U6P3_MAIZE|nr:uncharacterized protein LOC103626157 [Zea mays]|eukprot:XP_008644772.1 uncharacterized protein LOC103626157 [Zea mays]